MKRVAIFGVLAVVAGCGGNKDQEFQGNGREDLALEDAPAALTSAMCDAFFRCLPFQSTAFGSIESCSAYLEDQFVASSFGLIEDAVEEERVGYDQEKAFECISALEAASCTEIDLRTIEECNDVFTGTVERGDECTLDEECIGDSICIYGDSCPGTCADLLSAGEACIDDDQCEPGLVCSEATERCVVPAAEGEACGGDEPQCALPYICLGQDEDAGEAGVCLTAEDALSAEEGDACSFLGADPVICQEGLACQIEDFNATDGLISFCRPLVGEGEECGVALPSICPAGQYCAGIDFEAGELVGSCAPLPEEGESCSDDLFSPCALGSICLEGTCEALKNNGASCTVSFECKSENCVDGGCAPLSPCK